MEFLNHAEFWVFVSFIVFVITFFKPMRNAITKKLDQHRDKIIKNLEDARALREEANALLADYQRKHRDAMQDVQKIIDHATEEVKRIQREEAEKLAEALVRYEKQLAERIIHAEAQATEEIKQKAIEIAVLATQKILQDAVDHHRLDNLYEEGLAQLKNIKVSLN